MNFIRTLKIKWLFGAAIAFLYLYNFPYFAGIHSANELPRIYQTIAIVERGSLNIDDEIKRFQDTPDTSTYKGKIYPNKAPGMSLLCLPIFIVEKAVHGGKTPPLKEMFYWFRLWGAIIPSLLFLILLWRFLRWFIDDEPTRRLVLAGYALGTMAMTYGTLLIAHQLSALLMATSYVLLFEIRQKKQNKPTCFFAGLAAGAGVLVDYQVAFIGPPLFIYLLLTNRPPWRRALHFCLGSAIPLAILLFYHWRCFESPFRTGYNFTTTPLFHEWHSHGFLGMYKFTLEAFWGSFFRADNGFFYFSPFLALAFPGLYLMWREKRYRPDAIFCATLIVFFIYFVSSLTFWRSGWAVGPRYITCAIPYYLVPVAVLIKKIEKKWLLRAAAAGLIGVSIIIYSTANAVFPHYPENFSVPWFDLTLRFGRAGYLPYNLGWVFHLRGFSSVIPYLLVLLALLIALFYWPVKAPLKHFSVAVMVIILTFGAYAAGLRYRALPVPVGFLPWMHEIWEPRHDGLDVEKLIPAGDPRTGGLSTKK